VIIFFCPHRTKSQNSKKSHRPSKKVTSNFAPLYLFLGDASARKLDGFELLKYSGSF
jgi:hypothetical protein